MINAGFEILDLLVLFNVVQGGRTNKILRKRFRKEFAVELLIGSKLDRIIELMEEQGNGRQNQNPERPYTR